MSSFSRFNALLDDLKGLVEKLYKKGKDTMSMSPETDPVAQPRNELQQIITDFTDVIESVKLHGQKLITFLEDHFKDGAKVAEAIRAGAGIAETAATVAETVAPVTAPVDEVVDEVAKGVEEVTTPETPDTSQAEPATVDPTNEPPTTTTEPDITDSPLQPSSEPPTAS